METKQDKKDRILNVPNFRCILGTTHPKNGTYTKIKFDNGASGFILKPKGKPYEPICKLTDEYKNKTFPTLWDAVEALYASIKEFGNPKYQENVHGTGIHAHAPACARIVDLGADQAPMECCGCGCACPAGVSAHHQGFYAGERERGPSSHAC